MQTTDQRKLSSPPKMPKAFENITANIGLYKLLNHCKFSTVLDIGSGAGDHAKIFEAYNKQVTRFDFGKSRAFDTESQADKTIIGDYIKYSFDSKFDCIWASHVLEHTVFTHEFIAKIANDCKSNGFVAITVPPAKSQFVGGHVTLWTPALLLYRMVLAGIDCSKAKCLRYGYNITVIVKNHAVDVDLGSLAWDFHDIERLKKYFPPEIEPRMNGDVIGAIYEGAQINLVR